MTEGHARLNLLLFLIPSNMKAPNIYIIAGMVAYQIVTANSAKEALLKAYTEPPLIRDLAFDKEQLRNELRRRGVTQCHFIDDSHQPTN